MSDPDNPESEVVLEEFGGDGIDYSGFFKTDRHFLSNREALEWANEIAFKLNFALVSASKGLQKDHTNSDLGYNYFRCSRHSRPNIKNVDPDLPETPKRRKKKGSERCQCPFYIRAVQIREVDISKDVTISWIIEAHSQGGFHNHKLQVYKDGHRIFARLSPSEKQFLREAKGANIFPRDIKTALHKRTPDKAQPSSTQIYSELNKLRKEEKGGRNPAQEMFKKAVDNNYVEFHESVPGDKPNEEVITHLFMCHPEAVKLFRAYHHVVLIDSTYRTNPYDACLVEMVGVTPTGSTFLLAYVILPSEKHTDYEWMLRKLGELLAPKEGAEISTFVTDRELGLIKALTVVYPGTPHILCRWHLNRAIEERVKRNKFMSFHQNEILNDGDCSWRRVLYSTDRAHFEKNWGDFSAKWKTLADYVTSTWGEHCRKFILYFLNGYFHLGNTATSRVESAHSLVKKWLKSANLNLDTFWGRIHDMLNAQHSKIRGELEDSMSRHVFRGNFFNLLYKRVSTKALEIMEDELKRGLALKEEVDDECGHVLYTTHGLPCACSMVRALRDGHFVHVEDIHVFWRTLEYDKEEDMWPTNDTELEDMIGELRSTRGPRQRRVIEDMRRSLHPEDKVILPPRVRENPKGRPKGSTRRDKSSFEHARDAAGRGIPNPGRGNRGNASHGIPNSGCDIPSSSAGTPNIPVFVTGDFPAGVVGAPLEIGYTKGLFSTWGKSSCAPKAFWPYLDGWVDVIGDGNCGFRVMSHAVYGHEMQYLGLRQVLENEYKTDPRWFLHLNGGNVDRNGLTGYERHLRRIKFRGTGGCPEAHWLWDIDWAGFATCYNWTICMIGANVMGGRRAWSCHTYLPYRSVGEGRGSGPCGVLWVVLHASHWMRLHVTQDLGVVPMPPLEYDWMNGRDDSVAHYVDIYQENFALWHALRIAEPI